MVAVDVTKERVLNGTRLFLSKVSKFSSNISSESLRNFLLVSSGGSLTRM